MILYKRNSVPAFSLSPSLTSCRSAWMLLARLAAVSPPLDWARTSLRARGDGGSDTGWSSFTCRDLQRTDDFCGAIAKGRGEAEENR